MKAINLMATTLHGVQTFEIEDAPEADFCINAEEFLYEISRIDDDEVFYYQVLPAGTDGEYEEIDEAYGIH